MGTPARDRRQSKPRSLGGSTRASASTSSSTSSRLLSSLLAAVCILLAIWSAGPPPASAQDAVGESLRPGFTERLDIELVNVDVWVTDQRGDAVSGLGPSSFEILHDGVPVSITHFTEVRAGDAASPAGNPAEETVDPLRSEAATDTDSRAAPSALAASPSHVIVYFDQTRIHPSRYPALVGSLEQFLRAGVVDDERILILRQDGALSVEASFGSSRDELEQALRRLAEGSARGMDHETDTRLAIEAIRDGWEQAQDTAGSAAGGIASAPASAGSGQPPGSGSTASGTGGGPRAVVGGVRSGSGPDACGMFVNQVQPVLDSWTRSKSQKIAVTLTNLSSAAGFLAGLPGVKALLYLSDGLETQPGAELATYASSLCANAGTDLLTSTLSQQMTSGFRDLTRHANSNRVTIYALQTSGLRALGNDDASGGRRARGSGVRARAAFEASQRAGDRQGLGILAEDTGGRAVFHQNDLAPELLRIGGEIQHYYSLAYQPPAATADVSRRDHAITVQLNDDSMSARYRRGYLEKNRSQWLTERIEGALNLGLTTNSLSVRLGAGAVQPSAGGIFRLPLHVMVPVERLAFLPHQGEHFADVTLRVLTRALEGNELVARDQTFRVKGSPESEGLANLVVPLELKPGAHVTAIGVQDTNTLQASFVSTTLQVGPGG